MSRSLIVRVRALTLLLALLVGGFGLPLFDSLVFHGQPGAAVSGADPRRPGREAYPRPGVPASAASRDGWVPGLPSRLRASHAAGLSASNRCGRISDRTV